MKPMLMARWICIVLLMFLGACDAERDSQPEPSVPEVTPIEQQQPEVAETDQPEPPASETVEEAAEQAPAPAQEVGESEQPASQPEPEDTSASATYKVGEDYLEIAQAVRTQDPSRIEVTEVFWYGCGHCFHFEPLVEAWQAKLPDDVYFIASPAIWHPAMELHARAYYTAKALKVLDKLHVPIFEALNLKRKRLASEDEIAEVFVAHGVDKEVFHKMFNSFGVTSAVKQADARQRNYGIEGTPEVIVNGKYRITARLAGSQKAMLDVADFLIAKERKSLNQ